ncbi:methylenetetrahydrofolate reductase (NAD(P)H) met13 [Hypoxylon texense]
MRIPTLEDATRALSLSSLSSSPQKILSGGGLPNDLSSILLSPKAEIPGGSPFSFCEASRSTDLFAITDDVFTVHIYGAFQDSFTPNATIDLTVNCGSHCEEYGTPPGDRPGETTTADFCEMSEIEQPLGGREKRNATCPPEEGYALITSYGYVVPMFFSTPEQGWYNFTFDAKTAEGERIYCLTTEVCLRWEDEDKNKHYPPGRWNACRWPR